jgi:hypothetical protein
MTKQLSDHALLEELKAACAQERQATANVLWLFAEVDRRRLYAKYATSSIFDFAVRYLGFSEGAAYKRIHVSRAARKYPEIFELVAEGKLHLSGLCVLAPHLTTENHHQLLARASGKSKREIEKLIAQEAPKPDVPTSLRKLPLSLAPAMCSK